MHTPIYINSIPTSDNLLKAGTLSTDMKCIFCLIDTGLEPVEHIVSEGLVGHQPFEVKIGSIIAEPRRYLLLEKGEVCACCNNKLGRLDAYLQAQLGFLRTYYNPVGTKSGKAASAHRPGMYSQHRADGPHIFLNTGDRPITAPDGTRIAPAGSDQLAVRVKDFKIEGSLATMTIQQPIRFSKRFVRALHKIAFELLCFQEGADFVLDLQYGPIRRYILKGQGSRVIVLTRSAPAGTWEKPHFGLYHDLAWPGWLAIIRLAATFYIDLSPDNRFFAKVSPVELMANNMMKWSDQDGGRPIMN